MENQNYENFTSTQQIYAKILKNFTNIGIVLLFGTFAIYMAGLMEPLIPFSELPKHWQLPLNEFIAATGSPTGWTWLSYLDKGDYVNFIGIAILAGATGVCYIVAMFDLLKIGNKPFVIIAIIEIALILLSMANIVGGH